jgi:hypothetical protein
VSRLPALCSWQSSPQHTAPVQAIPIPEQCFTHIHMDLVRPLPASLAEGFKYLFTMPATRPLSYAEAAGQPHLNTPRRHAAAPVATVLGSLQGTGEGGQVFLVSSGWPRGDGQHRLPEAASETGAVFSGPPGGTRPPPCLRSCGFTAAASSGSYDYGGPCRRGD